jgi:hypothetical protein
VPRVIRFTADPLEVLAGDPSTLTWQVENAKEVTIEGVGAVDPTSGVSAVTPLDNTTYILTATNDFGSVSATASVSVVQPVRIVRFLAQPNPAAANEPFVLSWSTENATTVSISNNLGTREPTGSAILEIPATTTYTIVASNRLSTATATVEVVIPGAIPPGSPPIANAGADLRTTSAEITLDGSASADPDGGALTYEWRSLQPLQAKVLNPSQALTTIQFLTGGVYTFELKVTNPNGRFTTDTVVVEFVGTVPPESGTP